MSRVRDRLIGDFLMGPRLDIYRQLLERALQAGYEVRPVGAAWAALRDRVGPPARPLMVLRHDIDTDPATAAMMLTIDRSMGVASSYFFRLSTLAPDLMAVVADLGGEASYHYEELATIAKERALRTRTDAVAHLPEARDRFGENVTRLRRATGLPMTVVASHGDFVNIRLGAPNWLILADPGFRAQVEIELETYDADYLRRLPCRITDRAYPTFWSPRTPEEAIRVREPVISVLVHPRHWRVDRLGNARDDVKRLVEGVRFGLGLRA